MSFSVSALKVPATSERPSGVHAVVPTPSKYLAGNAIVVSVPSGSRKRSARALARLEAVLHGPILDELRATSLP